MPGRGNPRIPIRSIILKYSYIPVTVTTPIKKRNRGGEPKYTTPTTVGTAIKPDNNRFNDYSRY
jgi:hypothetical protein